MTEQLVDGARTRRETTRWILILALNNARPVGAWEETLRATLQGYYPDATPLETRRELDYLAERDLVGLKKEPSGRWFGHLTRTGVDVAEYTVECDPGIGRPKKYW